MTNRDQFLEFFLIPFENRTIQKLKLPSCQMEDVLFLTGVTSLLSHMEQ